MLHARLKRLEARAKTAPGLIEQTELERYRDLFRRRGWPEPESVTEAEEYIEQVMKQYEPVFEEAAARYAARTVPEASGPA